MQNFSGSTVKATLNASNIEDLRVDTRGGADRITMEYTAGSGLQFAVLSVGKNVVQNGTDDTTSMLFRMKNGTSGYLGTLTTTGTVDVAGCETRIVRRQLHVDRGELRGLTGTTEHGSAAELLVLLLRRAAADLQSRPYWAGCHTVYTDAFRT